MDNNDDILKLVREIEEFNKKHPDIHNDLYYLLRKSSIYMNFRAKVLCERDFKCSICDNEISFTTPYEQVLTKNSDIKLVLKRENTLIVCAKCQDHE